MLGIQPKKKKNAWNLLLPAKPVVSNPKNKIKKKKKKEKHMYTTLAQEKNIAYV